MGEVKESCRGFVLVQVWSVPWSHASPSPLCWALCKTCLLLQLRGDVIKSYLNAFSFSILQAIWAVILKGRFSAPPPLPPHHHPHPHGIDPGWSWEARAPPPPRGVDPPRGTGERGCRLRACVRAAPLLWATPHGGDAGVLLPPAPPGPLCAFSFGRFLSIQSKKYS